MQLAQKKSLSTPGNLQELLPFALSGKEKYSSFQITDPHLRGCALT
jgi:hypothetical protein